MSSTIEPAARYPVPQTRVFVGLKIASEIANKLAEFAAGIEGPSIRRVAPADIHLTLVPPWNEVSLDDATARLADVAARSAAFALLFQHVGYGPQAKRPRFLWAECAVTDEIARLRSALLETFGQTDERPFLPHVTLARIRAEAARIAKRHPVDQPLSLMQYIESIELFQSPPPGETGYRVLASLQLAKVPDLPPTG